MDNQLVVVLIYLAAIIAFISKAVRKGKERGVPAGRQPPAPPETRYAAPRRIQPEESEEERARKFMEALGVPTLVGTPRKIARPLQPVPRVRATVKIETPKPPYVSGTVAPPPVPVQPAAPQFSPYEEEKALPSPSSETEMAAAIFQTLVPAAQVKSVPPSAGASVASLTEFQSLLKSPTSIRAAMVLKEILGPPRSLQSFSGAPSLR